jgi:hypothetical protein
MLMPDCVTDDHEIIPEPGSARRVRDGQPADLRNPTQYPAEAVCLACGRPIRCEGWLLSEWFHIADPER